MRLRELVDQDWKKWERDRFLKDDTKTKTEAFDPEAFQHDGFEDRERYLETHVPGLADEERIKTELTTFNVPRLNEINDSPYQALVIRYGILRTLIQQPGYSMKKEALLDAVQTWQQTLLDTYSDAEYGDDNLLYLAKAAVQYQMDIDDSELNMVKSYCEVRNREKKWKHEQLTWLDFFKRLAAIDRFPKVSRSDKPSHALDTIEKGLWSLQEQALVYEIADPKEGDLVGIPEDYTEYVRDWLGYEMADENYLTMLETLEIFNRQSVLIEASDTFGIEKKNYGKNQKRRENIVETGVYPSDLLRAVVSKDELKNIVDRYGLDAHKQKTDDMIQKTIEYFEESQKEVQKGEPTVEIYLSAFEQIADGNIQQVPPQLQTITDDDDLTTKLDVLFEESTAEIFKNVFNLEETTLLGQQSDGIVTDGEIEQDGNWLLWDNKRRAGKFKLDSNTQSKIKNYIDTKNKQHNVEWFLIIAPDFSQQAVTNAQKLEVQVGTDIRLITATDFKRLTELWRDNFAKDGRELPLQIFYGSGLLDLDVVEEILERQFS